MTRRVARQERARATVRSVLRAGADVLQQDGAKHLTVRAIAQRARISVGTIYQYFGSKEELVQAIFCEQLASQCRDSISMARELEGRGAAELIDHVLRFALETHADCRSRNR